jgi:hypothetical protein
MAMINSPVNSSTLQKLYIIILNTYVTFNIHNMRLNCCVDGDDYEEDDSCTKDHLLINFPKKRCRTTKNAEDAKQLRGLLDVRIYQMTDIEIYGCSGFIKVKYYLSSR